MLFLGATGFSYVFRALGGDDLMLSMLAGLGIDTKWEILAFVMVLIFVLGFPFEWIEICLIVLPVFTPILAKLDFSDHLGGASFFMAWFGALVAVNLQTAFLSPPVAMSAYYLKNVMPQWGLTTIYKGMFQFMFIQVICLMLLILVPEIALWLPRAIR